MVKKKVLILILSYNAEAKILSVLDRIPDKVLEDERYDTEILILDDASRDLTYEKVVASNHRLKNRLKIFRNPVNLGYGGNQKAGYRYTLDNNFDAVILLHGDGQYAPEMLGDIVEPIIVGEADAVFGSRMLQKAGAIKGGMPYYKFIGNIILSNLQNWMLGSSLSEFHSGYRAYSGAALRDINFEANSDWFDFDTDIIIQILDAGRIIKEIEIPTYYGDEICHVNGIKYAILVIWNTLISRLHLMNLVYVRKYDRQKGANKYSDKRGLPSSHELAIAAVPYNSKVLDIGCGSGFVAADLKRKGCKVWGIDITSPEDTSAFEKFETKDLNKLDENPFPQESFEYILLLDVIEHLSNPEEFMEKLRSYFTASKTVKFIITTPNIAFITNRISLLFGSFSYTNAGIMDRTHTRLFTVSSLVKLLNEAGYKVERVRGVPAPFGLLFGKGFPGKILLKANNFLLCLSKGLFAYQVAVTAEIKPTPTQNLKNAMEVAKG